MEITIGLPVYNAEKYLEECIISILNQSYTSFKLLIIDDGSIDNSIAIINSFSDERIELIVDGQNRGLPYRLNQIASLCKTKYLARMDADDIMHVDRIKQQLETLDKHPEIDVLGTNCYVIDGDNKISGIRYKDVEHLSKVDEFIHPSIIAQTTWYLDNPYNIELKRSQDAELWSRTRNHSVFFRLNKPLLFYREVGGNYYKKYWTNLKSKRTILLSYQSNKQYIKALSYFFKTYLKAMVVTFSYSIAASLNLEHLLLKTRSHKLSTENKLRSKEEFNAAILKK